MNDDKKQASDQIGKEEKKFRIGLISINMYSKALNYACPLHTFAFQQFLLKHGIESTVINYYPVYFNDYDMEDPASYYQKLYDEKEKKVSASQEENARDLQYLDRYRHSTAAWNEIREGRKLRFRKFQNFIENNYIKTDTLYTSDTLELLDPGFDCYICVTDVIWKYAKDFGFDRGFFLGSSCMENKWKISYAASTGWSIPVDNEEEELFMHYINDIDFLSVRDQVLCDRLNRLLVSKKRKAIRVLDPVLLHDKDFYEKVAVRPADTHYLLVYTVVVNAKKRQATIESAAAFARKHGLKIIEVTDRPLNECSFDTYSDIESELRYTAGIEEWLGYFLYADYIFTNSFHACCFSIIFGKEFFVGPREGDKIKDLLTIFELTDRMLSGPKSDPEKCKPLSPAKITSILKEQREISTEFILSAIEYARTHEHTRKDYQPWKKKQTFQVHYHSASKRPAAKSSYQKKEGNKRDLPSGAIEFTSDDSVLMNSGESRFLPNRYSNKDHHFVGWHFRYRIDNQYFWLLENGSSVAVKEYDKKKDGPKYLCRPGEPLPFLPVNRIAALVAEASWVPQPKPQDKAAGCNAIPVIYRTPKYEDTLYWTYEKEDGEVTGLTGSGTSFSPAVQTFYNNGKSCFTPNQFHYQKHHFLGWNVQVHCGEETYWLLEDLSFAAEKECETHPEWKKYMSTPGSAVPLLKKDDISSITAVTVWKEHPKNICTGGDTYSISYSSNRELSEVTCSYRKTEGKVRCHFYDVIEFYPKAGRLPNDGKQLPLANQFKVKGHHFAGWSYCYRTPYAGYWLLKDGTVHRANSRETDTSWKKNLYIGAPDKPIPRFPSDCVLSVTAFAEWEETLNHKVFRNLKKIRSVKDIKKIILKKIKFRF